MKKNMITVFILAAVLMNMIMTAVIVFVLVPTSNKTNQLVTKVASIIDLELESPDKKEEIIAVSDIDIHEIEDKLTINLKKDGDKNHYAVLYVSLSINKKHEDTERLQPFIEVNESIIKEYVIDEFAKYTKAEVSENKEEIKSQILNRIQQYFDSDFIFSITFGNLILE